MTNPETLRNPETPETKQELRTLKMEIQVTGDRKKFETLLKNPTLKSGLDKILKKEAKSTISTFWEGYKINELDRHLFIESWTKRAIKSHPDLAGFICGDLGLPYSETSYISGTKFNELTFEQKMCFISFQETLRYYRGDISGISSSDFIKKYKTLANEHLSSMSERFNLKLADSQNLVEDIAGIVKLKNFLKEKYGLTVTECEKMEEYLKIIKKHPEYIVGASNLPEAKIKSQEAKRGNKEWMLFGMAIGALLSAGGYFTYKYFTGIFKLDTPETRVYGDHTEITNFEEVFKILSAKVETTSNRRQFEEEGYGHFDESTGGWIIGGAKWVGNKLIDAGNLVQSRKLDLEVKTEIGYLFDFQTAKFYVEVKDGKGYFHVKVKKPEVKVTNTEAKIHKSSREWINMDKFDDFELKCVETLKQEAIEEASKPEKIQKAKDALRKNMLSVFQGTGYAGDGAIVLNRDVEDVIIEYEDGEEPIHFDPEHRSTTTINN